MTNDPKPLPSVDPRSNTRRLAIAGRRRSRSCSLSAVAAFFVLASSAGIVHAAGSTVLAELATTADGVTPAAPQSSAPSVTEALNALKPKFSDAFDRAGSGSTAQTGSAPTRATPKSGTPKSGTPGDTSSVAPPADGLAASPLDADGLGFRMRVPVGTSVRLEKNPPNYLLSDAGDAPAWRIRAAALSASKAETTAASQCEDYITLMKSKGAGLEVLVNEPRKIGGRDAHLVYIAMPLEGGGRGITGNLVIPSGPDAYLVFATLVVDGEFERVRALLDRAFATLELKDTNAESLEKLGLLARGTEIILGFSEERLRSTIAPDPACYRMWRPDADGG
ncbi:MAG: hypothetical protein ACKO3W_06930, partial [bacterium]